MEKERLSDIWYKQTYIYNFQVGVCGVPGFSNNTFKYGINKYFMHFQIHNIPNKYFNIQTDWQCLYLIIFIFSSK